ncbi:MAG: hypothetical protein LBR68_05350, partial [Lachnoclostridium sp.]|nr:hypothetical protein [Lachnoclostridium sp.]
MMKIKKIILCSFAVLLLFGTSIGIYLLISEIDVLGKYEAEEPFVEGEPENLDFVVTDQTKVSKPASVPTPEGNTGTQTQNPKDPNLMPEIPEARGEKGTSTNPFVVLEIVSDKALQTLSYMDEGSEPYDPIDLMVKMDRGDIDITSMGEGREDDINEDRLLEKLGQIFHEKQYEVYRPPNEEKINNGQATNVVFKYDFETEAKSLADPFFEDKVDPREREDSEKWIRTELP